MNRFFTLVILLAMVFPSSIKGAEKHTLLDGGPSPECIALLSHAGKEWVVAGSARRASLVGSKEGAIMIHQAGTERDFKPMAIVENERSGLTIAGDKRKSGKRPFTPLGLWVADVERDDGPRSETRLYVTNSQKVMSTIEIFTVVDGPQGIPQLKWESALLGWNADNGLPAFVGVGEDGNARLPDRMPDKNHLFVGGPNAVAVAKDGTMYVSNTFRIRDALGRGASKRTPQAGSSGAQDRLHDTIVACRPGHTGWHIVAYDLGGANGLTLSRDEKDLVASSYFKKQLFAFRREPGNAGKRELGMPKMLFEVEFHPDNVTTSSGGTFLVAGQRSPVAVFFSSLTSGRTRCRGGWAEHTPGVADPRVDLADYGVAGPSTALRVGQHVYISSLPGKRVARIPSER